MSKYIINTDNMYGKDIYKSMLLMGTNGRDVIVQKFNLDELEELNSDYINEHFGDLQDTAYQRGLDDAWEAARKLFSSMADSDIEKAFPTEWNNGGFHALINLQPQEAIEKLKAYEEKQKADDKIEVGDEVIYNGTTKCIVVRPEDDERYASLIDSDGTHYSADHRECKKTGRHFDIKGILEAMKHD